METVDFCTHVILYSTVVSVL